MTDRPVLVLGASGYVGARLVPKLIEQGYTVRAGGRSVSRLGKRPWAKHPQVSLCEVDVFDEASLQRAAKGCGAVFYLVHSMSPSTASFETADRNAANNMVKAAESGGVDRIIYLGGLGQDEPGLSKHLQSRFEVGEILRSGSVPVTILRAAMIIGSGSASFEILRYLVERLPVMITPKWVRTEAQPIAIGDVLAYLLGCLEHPETKGRTFDIGGPGIVNYRDLMRIYSEEAHLTKRLVVPVPVLTPRLSSYWIHLVTPVPASLARPLAEGLSNRVVCHDTSILDIVDHTPTPYRLAFRKSLDEVERKVAGIDPLPDASVPAEWTMEGDPHWSGGSIYVDNRRIVLKASPEDIWEPLCRIGGKNGWYYANWLWWLRGILDRLVGGVGLRKGRTHSDDIEKGDIVDFWRVSDVKVNERLRLVAEMRVPGYAVLEFDLRELGDGRTELSQIARFATRGLLGVLYWYAVSPLHNLVFNGMLKGIARKSKKPVLTGPERI